MSPQEVKQLKAIYVSMAMYYGIELKDSVLTLYIQDLIDLEYADILKAIGLIRKDRAQKSIPRPADIRFLIKPDSDPETDAVEAAARILSAISRIGPYRSQDAKQFIGSIGWHVVERDGGWESICASVNSDNIGTLRAQWRQLALSAIHRMRAGIADSPPELQDYSNKKISVDPFNLDLNKIKIGNN